MSAAVTMERIREASPRFKARTAGVSYLLAVLTAVFGEFLIRGRLSFAAGLIAVGCYTVVTLFLYDLFKQVNRRLALFAAFFQLVALTFEVLRLQPRGMNIAMVFHAFFCLLIAYLIFRSTFLPRILSALMAIAGFCWLTNLLPPLANYLYPGITFPGLLGEGLPMLWLLVFGVNVLPWKEQASEAEERQ